MKKKIFKKSDISGIKRNLKFNSQHWLLRSAPNTYKFFVNHSDCCGIVCNYLVYGHAGVLPVCTI